MHKFPSRANVSAEGFGGATFGGGHIPVSETLSGLPAEGSQPTLRSAVACIVNIVNHIESF